tara:strand:- start:294 stop:1460 length:1167 start_codon:yes stop_codon:yes gene_type:complete
MIPWTKKYSPKNTKEILGHELAVDKIKKNLYGKKRILLHGLTGTGKTTLVHALAKELNLEIFELNASDARNKKAIVSMLGSSAMQQSLFSKGKLILIDDIDALSGRKDRGGLPTIISIMQETKHPVILTCIDAWTKKLSPLRKKTLLVELQSLKNDTIVSGLKIICEAENIIFNKEDLNLIAKESKGDMRAAINDLQSHTATGSLILDNSNYRDKEQSIHYCLRKVLKSRKWEEVHNIFYNVNMDLNNCLLWLDENLPKEYDSESRKKAYERISRADVFNGRIRRGQYWRFLVYIQALLTSGVAFAKESTNPNFSEYKRSERILKLWLANQRYAKKKSICEKLALATHTSKKQALRNTFPYLKTPLLQNKSLQEELELSEEELIWLQK